MKTKACKKCGDSFVVEKGNYRYCSNCRFRNCLICGIKFTHKEIKTKLCSLTCKKEFYRRTAKPPSRKGIRMPEGYVAWNKGKNSWGKTISCSYCGKDFRIKVYRLKRSNSLSCSPICYYKLKDKGLTPKNKKIRMSSNYIEWRTAVFERDSYTCQICGQRGGELNADHIKPFSIFPQDRFNLSNGRTLCVSCHRQQPTTGLNRYTKEVYVNYN
jgi:5-methylcytosine-specific restriction endonuclease McrA